MPGPGAARRRHGRSCSTGAGRGDAREIARGDHVPGMTAAQAEPVHQGVTYDIEVDTTRSGSMECARLIAAHLG
ncbi:MULTISPECIES: hypothetical protein [unclassified Streptomyces]|uniref:phosphotransferase-like protein n=1 Tax=unclassified Streptomyces TaxID=2593676 RepID=UPI00380AFD38